MNGSNSEPSGSGVGGAGLERAVKKQAPCHNRTYQHDLLVRVRVPCVPPVM